METPSSGEVNGLAGVFLILNSSRFADNESNVHSVDNDEASVTFST